MIEIRIRHEDDARAVPLCTWDASRLDDLIPLIEHWGLAYHYDTTERGLSGGFVVADGAAFFEVLIHELPEAEAQP